MSNLKPEDSIKNLEKLAQEGFEIIENINRDVTAALKIPNMYYDSICDMMLNNFESLNTVSVLVKHKKFKDCFTLLRPVFESMLYFWLVVDGKKYRSYTSYFIRPDDNESSKDARDETYDLWYKKWKEKDPHYKDVVTMDKSTKKDDEIVVVSEHIGLYNSKDNESINDLIPWYFFILTNQYNQFVKFNSDLPSIKIGDTVPNDYRDKDRNTQNTLYNNYISISAIWKNLQLNELITKVQEEHIRIHYNYLSSYVHTTKEFFQFTKGASLLQKSDVSESIVTEQIWLYICRIQCIFLRILVERITKNNPNASMTRYTDLIQRMDAATSHFWFFDNESTPYDIERSNIRKDTTNLVRKKRNNIDDTIVYYQDPVQRLHEYRYWLQSQNKDMD